MKLKLFLISQDENNDYDTYDAAVVAAPDEEAARNIIPGCRPWGDSFSYWCKTPASVTVKYLGEASDDIEPGIVCASFNAG